MIDTLFFEHHLRSYLFSLFSLLVVCMIYSMLKINKHVSCPMGGVLVQFSMHFQTVQAASLFSNYLVAQQSHPCIDIQILLTGYLKVPKWIIVTKSFSSFRISVCSVMSF